MVIENIRNKALRRFWEKGDLSAIRPDWRPKVRIVLAALDTVRVPTDPDLPEFGFHPLVGDRIGRFAITVSRNWRITFAWSGEDAIDVDLEDYHGR